MHGFCRLAVDGVDNDRIVAILEALICRADNHHFMLVGGISREPRSKRNNMLVEERCFLVTAEARFTELFGKERAENVREDIEIDGNVGSQSHDKTTHQSSEGPNSL